MSEERSNRDYVSQNSNKKYIFLNIFDNSGTKKMRQSG